MTNPVAPPAAARRTPLATTLLVAFAPLSFPAFAEADTDADDLKRFHVVRVIANSEDPQSSMGSAYVLTERELEKFSSPNINDVLRSVPGVYTREENGL